MTGPTPARDPGLQPERTRLAWRRTVLTATVVTLLALRLAAQRPTPVAGAATAVLVTGWVGLLLLSRRRTSTLSATAPPPPRWVVPASALLTVGFAGAGLALVTTP